MSESREFHCERAWLPPGRVASHVLVTVAGERIAAVREGVAATPTAVRLGGLVLPGFANAHSHAFHRALRGRTQHGRGDFWTWRRLMYDVAARLDPDRYLALARAAYAEMALAGITCVGEFHYLHHDPDGRPYAERNAMGQALARAADEAGLRITLLDTCYLRGGVDQPLDGVQRRFSDGDAEAWASRVDALAAACARSPHVRVGAGVHSVRAVPAAQLPTVAGWADAHDAPLHVHLSEHTDENDACVARYGRTPTGLLADHGVLGPRTTAVHATHLDDGDVAMLGSSATTVCLCPTTERDLADGIGPARRLADAGCPLALGSDSHAIVDPFEEARALELDERLATRTRGHWRAAALLEAATVAGHRSLGWADGGAIAAGAPADLVAVGLDSVRTAGWDEDTLAETIVFAASAADVSDVVASGRHVVRGGAHVLGDVAGLLREAVGAVT